MGALGPEVIVTGGAEGSHFQMGRKASEVEAEVILCTRRTSLQTQL